MCDRSDSPPALSVGPDAAACRPARVVRPRGWMSSFRGLVAKAMDSFWREDQSLRALARIDSDRISDLSETGRRLRRDALRRMQRHR